jgi:hypothetical protein
MKVVLGSQSACRCYKCVSITGGCARDTTNQLSRAHVLQGRLEQDMLDNAFVDRTQEVLSALQRGTHTSSSMASQWMHAAQGAATFLQVPAPLPFLLIPAMQPQRFNGHVISM